MWLPSIRLASTVHNRSRDNAVSASAERNIRLYPVYRAAADAMAWLPIFFLYFSEHLTLPEVLLLEAVYYIAVVITEVPSGYLSDLVGRCRTLLLSCIALLAGYVCFLLSSEFAGFAAGQILIACSMAFRSGTDTAFHYESLQVLGRAEEYGDREAIAGKYGFASTAVAALAGGILGSIDLSLPYYLSLLAAGVSLYITLCFTEPASENSNAATSAADSNFFDQLGSCIAYLKHPLILWLFIYSMYMTTFVHIPYEFYQPYLHLLDDRNQLAGISSPLMAGVLFALTAIVASVSSAYSMRWQRSIGLMPLLTGAAAIELFIIAAMAILLHPLIALLVILRSGPMAVVTAPTNAAIAPHIANQQRATFLSLQSLAGRLAFAIVLLGFSMLVTNSDGADWSSLSLLLRVSTIAGLAGLLILHITSKRKSLNQTNPDQM